LDLSGIAALLGVPAAVAAVVLPLALEVAPLRRLERVEKVLSASKVKGEHLRAVEDARNLLAARVAFSVIAPRARFLLIYGSFELVWGGFYVYAAVFSPTELSVAGLTMDHDPATFWAGFANIACGAALIISRSVIRSRAWKRTYDLER
jgi:hypothetical protein